MQLNDKISKFETLLEEKENLEDAKGGRELMQLKKIEFKLEELIEEMDKDIINLETELKSQRKKPKKFPDIKTKEEVYKLLKDKIEILKKKYKGEDVDEEKIEDNRTALEKLEDLLKKNHNDDYDYTQDRELNQEEKDKMDEWKQKEKEQNEMLDEIAEGVREIGNQAKLAGKGIKDLGKIEKQTEKKMGKTTERIKSQNERLKELVNKIRSSDKICCDLVLILILIGLVCVLYSIIKHKYQ